MLEVEKMLSDSIYPVFLPQSLLTNLITLQAHSTVDINKVILMGSPLWGVPI